MIKYSTKKNPKPKLRIFLYEVMYITLKGNVIGAYILFKASTSCVFLFLLNGIS
ncbi:hypothetical protein DFQ08_103191 [Winogradskyella arenosi]|uniref:Uncharacterized protein n=1 Tax=Winogradskyella arenosi TaxID=533325 RepID=A0A368ZGA7_9FLAO|nr:hypothetical protein DFQ08_103191 [Winogradskyella arenosi]